MSRDRAAYMRDYRAKRKLLAGGVSPQDIIAGLEAQILQLRQELEQHSATGPIRAGIYSDYKGTYKLPTADDVYGILSRPFGKSQAAPKPHR